MIRVIIVEDIREIREGLQLLIAGNDGFACDHVFPTAEQAIKELPALRPDVVLMDIHLPGINGIEAVRTLRVECPGTQFIISTVYEDDEKVFESLKAGANGYLLKKTAPAKILDAITEVYHGGSPMSSQIARKVISSFRQKDALSEATLLTTREKEILKALAKGLRYKEVADEMAIGIETVRTHIRHIYEKLQVSSRTEALNKFYRKE